MLTIDAVMGLPTRVCVLDIETEYVEFQNPEGCILAFVGLKVFGLSEGVYQAQNHKYYLPGEMADLEQFLRSFDGLIIGHNIFAFDYRALRPLLLLDGILEKTVDTLDFLARKNRNRLKGLSLDHLSRANLGKGKTLDGASTPELWRQGRRDEVIAYNENDCILNMELWQHLVRKRAGTIRYYDKDTWTDVGTFEISKTDLLELLGQKPKYTYSAWKKKVETGGFTRQKKSRPQAEKWGDVAMFWEPELALETSYRWHYCKAVNQTFLFEQQDLPGDRGDIVTTPCPGCGIENIGVLEDHSLIGHIDGDAGTGIGQGDVPDEFSFLLAEHMQHSSSRWTVLPQFTSEENPESLVQCTLCGRLLDVSPLQLSYENPVDESPICIQCLTAGRWMLSLK